MYQVLKRDGKVVDFKIEKISEAIKLAFEAQEKNYHPDVIDLLGLKVTADFESAQFLNCEGHIEDGAVVLDSTLYPYEFAAIVLKLK